MSKAIISNSILTAIANAIRSKLGTSSTIKPSQMASAIESINTSKTEIELEANQNGIFTPESGKVYSKVTVNVQSTSNRDIYVSSTAEIPEGMKDGDLLLVSSNVN